MIILNADDAGLVRGISPIDNGCALSPFALRDGSYILPVEVIDDPAHADVKVLLSGLPTRSVAASELYGPTETEMYCIPQWKCVGVRGALVAVNLCSCSPLPDEYRALPTNYLASPIIELNDNGAWSWFQDQRAIVANGKLIVGSVRAVGTFSNGADENWGNVEVSVLDIENQISDGTSILFQHFEQDDHDNPALLELPDGRILAAFSKHGIDRIVYSSRSEVGNPLSWGTPQSFTSPGQTGLPFMPDNVTYANLFRLSSGRILNFYRGPGYDWNYMVSDDDGETWSYGGKVLDGGDGYGPYMKFAQAGDVIHFVVTEDHPREFNNSLYHGYLQNGTLYKSDGTEVGPLSITSSTEIEPTDFTKIFQGDADNVPWMTDVEIDGKGAPIVLFTVQKDGAGLPRGQGGFDHRFHYARWDGSWSEQEIAYAGSRLYASEDDYTGLGAIDPNDSNVIYLSTDAHPTNGAALYNRSLVRHREIFKGVRSGAAWQWTSITANSDVDNIRPIVPRWSDGRTSLVWMRGMYRANRGEWSTKVVATIIQ